MKGPRPSPVRSCAAITGSVLAFALLIEPGGLMPAAAVAAFVASLGSPAPNLRDALILSAVLALAMGLVFVGLLEQSFTLFPGF